MKWMKNWKQNTRRAAALVLGAVLVIGNLGAVSYAEENGEAESVVGYSDALVEKKNLSTVTSYTVFQKMSDEDKKATEEIKIGTAQELWDFSNDYSKFYGVVDGYADKTIYLDNDIKMTDINQIPMSPIGYNNDSNNHKTFKGTFDGQGHEINVVIDDATHNGVGLFGAMGKGTVKNLIFSGSVSGQKHQVGGIVGIITGGSVTIENCYNKANVVSTYKQSADGEGKTIGGLGQYVGGIVGFINGGTNHKISNCTNEGEISAMRNVGGIAGGINSSTAITNCRNIGEVQAKDYSNITTAEKAKQIQQGCGGIVGLLKNNPTTITNCINDGRVRTWACTAAGIVGNVQKEGCILSEVYNYGTVTNSDTNGMANAIYNSSTSVSGILENEINVVNSTTPTPEDETITNAAKEADTSIVSVTKNIVGYSDARVVRVDLTDVMSMTEYLDSNTDTSGVKEVKISTATELKNFLSQCRNKSGYADLTIYLEKDIDAKSTTLEPGGTSGQPFQGTFDGQGYEIAGLSIEKNAAGTGLFAYAASGAIIRNLILSGTISGKGQVGSIIGSAYRGEVTIENCYNKTDVTGTGTYVGGIVGIVSHDPVATATIKNCTNTGTIKTISDVGGVVGGALDTTTITNCRNAGTVTATGGTSSNGCGSIVGKIRNKTTIISGCINNGTINNGSCVTAEDTSYGYLDTSSTNKGVAKVSDMENYSSDNTADTSYEVATKYADTLIGDNAGTNRREVASITKDIVGYSDARVEYVDLSQIKDYADYAELEDKSSVTKVKISTAEELQNFVKNNTAEKGYPKLTAYLANDIDMTGKDLPTSGGTAFQGTFDGQGYEIIGISVAKTGAAWGLFRYAASGAKIKNLILSGTISAGVQAGGFAGNVNAGQVTIENCYNKTHVTGTGEGTTKGIGTYIGGIVGMVANGAGVEVSNCTNAGVIKAETDVGGLIGGALGTTNISNSRNIGDVTVVAADDGTTAGTAADGCGGLVGIVKNQVITIKESINNGAVNAGACTGAGIIGTIEKIKGCSIADTTNYGTVTAGDGGKAYAVYGMTTGTYVKEDGYAIADKTGETDAGIDAAKEEGTKHTGWILGDANGDGEVDILDLVRIKRCAAGQSEEVYGGADTNRDNVFTDADASACRIVLLNQIFYEKGLEKLTVLALGDSYFAGQGLPQDQVWIHLMARKYGMDMKNYGIGGSTVSDCENGANPMVNRYSTLITENPTADIILVEGGRNDSSKKAAIGDVTLENQDPTTYVGALNIIINNLRAAYPNAMIVCLTPWNFPDREGYLSSQDYGDAMSEIAKLQGVKCIRAYDPDVSGVNMQDPNFPEKYSMSSTDVSHLNLEGMKIVEPRFEKLLAEYWEEFNHEK